jgi:hypothetical protein
MKFCMGPWHFTERKGADRWGEAPLWDSSGVPTFHYRAHKPDENHGSPNFMKGHASIPKAFVAKAAHWDLLAVSALPDNEVFYGRNILPRSRRSKTNAMIINPVEKVAV